MNSVSIRKNDTVKVIAGKDKGKTGRVLRVEPVAGKVLIEHIGMIKKHMRADQQQKGGIAEKESPVNISNVQLVCKNCGQPRRAASNEQGQRACSHCKTVME